MDCGLPEGVWEEQPLREEEEEEEGAGWICKELVKTELQPDAVVREMKGEFHSPKSFKPSADFMGKGAQSPSPFTPRFLDLCGFSQQMKEAGSLVCPMKQPRPELSPTQQGLPCKGPCAQKGLCRTRTPPLGSQKSP